MHGFNAHPIYKIYILLYVPSAGKVFHKSQNRVIHYKVRRQFGKLFFQHPTPILLFLSSSFEMQSKWILMQFITFWFTFTNFFSFVSISFNLMKIILKLTYFTSYNTSFSSFADFSVIPLYVLQVLYTD